jgi:Ca-activated chloride channel family protein
MLRARLLLATFLSLALTGCHGPMDGAAYSLARQAEGEEAFRYRGPMNTEEYDDIVENPFLDPRTNPLSTFAVDVDTASYSNVRRLLNDGTRPPAGAVRIEEMVNYFDYDYPAPRGERPFEVVAEVGECPWSRGHRLVHLGIQGKRIEPAEVPPRNLVFLLDVSGSMMSPRKLPLVKQAMKMLVGQLREEDTVAIVVYAGASGLVLPPTSGADGHRILDALTGLQAGGSTNGGSGISLAYRTAEQGLRAGAINRVILATDGDFNVGVTNRSELVRLIETEREKGIYLTVLGFGAGNLKDSTMESLADRGNGNYAYIDNAPEARKVLVEEVGGTLVTIAKDVKIQVEFNPERVGSYRLIGYENRLLRAEDFDDDEKDAGEIGAGHTVTALYEITPPRERASGRGELRYQQPGEPTAASRTGELFNLKIRYKEPDGAQSRLITFPVEDPVAARTGTEDFRFSAAVAAFGMMLRDSEYRGEASWGLVKELAKSSLGEDPHGYRAEFVRLVALAEDLGSED